MFSSYKDMVHVKHTLPFSVIGSPCEFCGCTSFFDMSPCGTFLWRRGMQSSITQNVVLDLKLASLGVC